MAGMLAGVECARRRRFHGSGGDNFSGEIRRPSSFCLYPSNHEASGSFAAVASERIIQSEAYDDERLEDSAREAKERLDERLRLQRRSFDTKRSPRTDMNSSTPSEKDGAKSSRLGKLRAMKLKRWLSAQ